MRTFHILTVLITAVILGMADPALAQGRSPEPANSNNRRSGILGQGVIPRVTGPVTREAPRFYPGQAPNSSQGPQQSTRQVPPGQSRQSIQSGTGGRYYPSRPIPVPSNRSISPNPTIDRYRDQKSSRIMAPSDLQGMRRIHVTPAASSPLDKKLTEGLMDRMYKDAKRDVERGRSMNDPAFIRMGTERMNQIEQQRQNIQERRGR